MSVKPRKRVHPALAEGGSRSTTGILKHVFGHDGFRGRQEEIVETLIKGEDVIAFMPTGAGKSLCYQLPMLARDGMGVVISPLIALMEDQVASLRQNGVRAASLNSGLSQSENRDVRTSILKGEIDILYVAPERLVMESMLSLLEQVPVSAFAIDEAHCISQWGHDFRPVYLSLDILTSRFPGVPRIALTATADPQTQTDIAARLKMEGAKVFLTSFDRPNIHYAIELKDNPKRQLLTFIKRKHSGHSGIVYCLSRKKVEETASWLREQGIRALPYHAGLSHAERAANQKAFLTEEGLVLSATIAFGMGVDKPDIRFVAHLDLPGSVEAYYQETGRAGRDGEPADAMLFYGMGDVALRRSMIDQSEAEDGIKRIERAKLSALLGICETAGCRRIALLSHFGEKLPAPCGNCDTCRRPVEVRDGTVDAQKALSAVYRTGQRFGTGHLIDILTGNKTDKVANSRHDTLPTFGIGTDRSRPQWQSIFRQLVARGSLEIDHGQYGAIRLSGDAREILRGDKTLQLRVDARSSTDSRAKSAFPAAPSEDLSPSGQALFATLKAKRLEIAREQNLPPYIILHDRTLADMARRRPKTLADLEGIPGIGASKIERYGAAFLSIMTDHG